MDVKDYENVCSPLKDKLMVAAVDFGTTFSGYAFSFRHDYQNNPLDIKIDRKSSCRERV